MKEGEVIDYTVNPEYKEEELVQKKMKKVEADADPVSTIDKFLDKFYPDLIQVQRDGIIGYHAGKILSESEWKKILLDDLSRRV
jgi:hypothetical protein